MINVETLIPIDTRGFFRADEVGKRIIKRRSTVIQLVNQYVDRVITEREYEIALHDPTSIIPTVISMNLKSRQNKAI
jgi:hypothetical protein